jgi:hypothetical protein
MHAGSPGTGAGGGSRSEEDAAAGEAWPAPVLPYLDEVEAELEERRGERMERQVGN